MYIYLLSFVETPRKFMLFMLFIYVIYVIYLCYLFVFPQSLTSILYSPCKRTRNLNVYLSSGCPVWRQMQWVYTV